MRITLGISMFAAVATVGCAQQRGGTASCDALLAPAALVYPIPGATNVPTSFPLVLRSAPRNDRVALRYVGNAIPLAPLGSPPPVFPSPAAATPAPGVPAEQIFQSVTVSSLRTQTTYSVSVAQPAGDDCGPARTYGIGTFTTQ